MRKTITLLLTLLISLSTYTSNAQQTTKTMTDQERTDVLNSLKETEANVFKVVKGLTDAQLKFKPAPDKWSVEECIKHIAAAEQNLWLMVDASLHKPANPHDRAGIKMTDEELLKAVKDRSHKSKTFDVLEPVNSPYKTTAEALAAFKESRAKLITFMKATQADLRNHVSVLPIGTYDAYQFVLLISGHTDRHTQQINEVKGSTGFPK